MSRVLSPVQVSSTRASNFVGKMATGLLSLCLSLGLIRSTSIRLALENEVDTVQTIMARKQQSNVTFKTCHGRYHDRIVNMQCCFLLTT